MDIPSWQCRSGLPRCLRSVKRLPLWRIRQAEAHLHVVRIGPEQLFQWHAQHRHSSAYLQVDQTTYTFQHVEWTDLHPPEHYSFSRCNVIYEDVEYEGWVYYPHPETKLRHFQDPSLLEVIAYPIPEIKYGDEVQILVDAQEIEVSRRQMLDDRMDRKR